MDFYPFYQKNYLIDTHLLSEMEDLAYRRMIDWYMSHEKPLPKNIRETAREIRMLNHLPEVEYVLSKFFIERNDGWNNIKCNETIDMIHKRSARAREKAEKRWNAKKEGHAMALPLDDDLDATASENNATASEIDAKKRKEKKRNNTAYPDWFLEFWKIVLTVRSENQSKASSFKKMKGMKVAEREAVMADYPKRFAGSKFPKALHNYINDRLWEEPLPVGHTTDSYRGAQV